MKRAKYPILFALLGFAAIVAQIVLQRRFIVVFGGNELTIGVVFAGWMLWAGLGNLVAGRFADGIKNIPRALTFTFLAIAIILPVTVLATSLIKAALGIPPPRMMGPPLILFSTLILLFPLCFAIGAALVLAARLPATGSSSDIGTVYIFDSIGSAVGGILFSWFAIRFLTPLQTSFFISAVLLAGVGLILLDDAGSKLTVMFAAIVFAALFFMSGRIESVADNIQWKGFHPIADFDSRFGNIVVTENRGEHTLFFDGVPQFSTPLPDTYETAAYLPLLLHENPKDVLLIGGGLSGMVQKWRDVDLKSITYLQIDPDVTAAEGNLMVPKEMLSDPRLKIRYVDGRDFLAHGDGKYDVIIVQAGDPATAATNRYYTEEFFKNVKVALRPDGIIFFGVFETTNYISAEAQSLLGSIYSTLNRAFDHIIILPLYKYYFAASAQEGGLTDDVALLESRLKKSKWEAPTLLSQVLYGIYPERVSQIRSAIIKAAGEAKTFNTDRHPIAYYTGLVLWASKAGENAANFLESLEKIKLWHVISMLAVAAFITISFMRQRGVEAASVWALFAVGFSSIVYEMVLLIWYQVKVGLLFYRLGIIITAFMIGLSVGAYGAIKLNRYLEKPENRSQKSEARIQRLIALGLVVFALYMPLLFIISRASFPFANFLCGAAAGLIYQMVADRLVLKKKLIGKSAALINFSDYLGAAAGSILASIVMIPLFGLFPALLVAALMLVFAASVSVLLRKT